MKMVFISVLLLLLFSFLLADENDLEIESQKIIIDSMTKKLRKTQIVWIVTIPEQWGILGFIIWSILKEDIEKLKILENEGWRFHHLSGLYESLNGNSGIGLQHLKQAVALNKDNIEVFIHCAQFELLEVIKKAISNLEELKVNLEEFLEVCNYNLAGGYYQTKQYEEVLKCLEQIKIKDFDYKRLRGKILIEMGSYEKGIKELKDLLKQKTENIALALVIIKYQISRNKLNEASKLLDKILQYRLKDQIEDFESNLINKEEDLELIIIIAKYYVDKKNISAEYLLTQILKHNHDNEVAKKLLDQCHLERKTKTEP